MMQHLVRQEYLTCSYACSKIQLVMILARPGPNPFMIFLALIYSTLGIEANLLAEKVPRIGKSVLNAYIPA